MVRVRDRCDWTIEPPPPPSTRAGSHHHPVLTLSLVENGTVDGGGVPDPHPSVLRDLARRCLVSGLQRKVSRQVRCSRCAAAAAAAAMCDSLEIVDSLAQFYMKG